MLIETNSLAQFLIDFLLLDSPLHSGLVACECEADVSSLSAGDFASKLNRIVVVVMDSLPERIDELNDSESNGGPTPKQKAQAKPKGKKPKNTDEKPKDDDANATETKAEPKKKAKAKAKSKSEGQPSEAAAMSGGEKCEGALPKDQEPQKAPRKPRKDKGQPRKEKGQVEDEQRAAKAKAKSKAGVKKRPSKKAAAEGDGTPQNEKPEEADSQAALSEMLGGVDSEEHKSDTGADVGVEAVEQSTQNGEQCDATAAHSQHALVSDGSRETLDYENVGDKGIRSADAIQDEKPTRKRKDLTPFIKQPKNVEQKQAKKSKPWATSAAVTPWRAQSKDPNAKEETTKGDDGEKKIEKTRGKRARVSKKEVDENQNSTPVKSMPKKENTESMEVLETPAKSSKWHEDKPRFWTMPYKNRPAAAVCDRLTEDKSVIYVRDLDLGLSQD